MGSPGDSLVKNMPATQSHRRRRFDPWVGKIPWRRAWQPTPVFLPGESHGQGSLEGYSPQGHKESDMTEATKHSTAYNKDKDTSFVKLEKQFLFPLITHTHIHIQKHIHIYKGRFIILKLIVTDH